MNQIGLSDAARMTEALTDTWSPTSAAVAAGNTQPDKRRLRSECGYAGCTAPWSRLWRRNGRPGFEGRWGCSRGCLRGLVEGIVRREMADVEMLSGSSSPHRHRVPLGLVLLAQGWITHPQLQHALAAQKAAGRGRIGDWLVEECGVEQMQVTRGLGVQWNRPVLSPTGFDARSMALVMPSTLREELNVLPVRVAADRLLYLGFQDGVDAAVAMAIERMTGLGVESGIMSAGDYQRTEVRLRERKTVDCEEESLDGLDSLTQRVVGALSASQPVEARLVRVRERYWLRMWLEPAATVSASMLPVSGEDVIDRVYSIRNRQASLA